jgi:gamma-glutamyl:cysteine ligase YbdK (ATP-grasp superfamily)
VELDLSEVHLLGESKMRWVVPGLLALAANAPSGEGLSKLPQGSQ